MLTGSVHETGLVATCRRRALCHGRCQSHSATTPSEARKQHQATPERAKNRPLSVGSLHTAHLLLAASCASSWTRRASATRLYNRQLRTPVGLICTGHHRAWMSVGLKARRACSPDPRRLGPRSVCSVALPGPRLKGGPSPSAISRLLSLLPIPSSRPQSRRRSNT